jgi:Cu2+-exporting ATPase
VQSDVGIAIGAGTDVAIESAKMVLVKNDPRDVAKLIRLSKATMRKMKENLFWATGYNVIALPVAAGILSPYGVMLRPEFAALIMASSSIIVVTNALLLRNTKL